MAEAEKPSAGTDAPPTRRRRWRRRLLVAAVVALALALLLRALLPTLIERGAAWAAPRYLGLPVRIANADLWLSSGAIALEGLEIGSRPLAAAPAGAEAAAPPKPPPPLLHWDRLYVDLDWRPLLDRTVSVHELALDGPAVRLERAADGGIDPLAHAQPSVPPGPPAEAPPPESEEPSEPWTIAVERLALRRPDVAIVDEASGGRLVEVGFDELGLDAIRVKGSEIGLGGVSLARPVVKVRRDFVFEGGARKRPAAEPEGGAKPAAGTKGGGAADARIEKIGIERAQFTLITDAGPIDVSLALSAEGVTAREGETFPLRVELGIEKGTVLVDGRVGALPPSFVGKLAWKELPFPLLLLAARPELTNWLRSCSASGALDVDAHLAATGGRAAGVRASGTLRVDGLELGDPGKKEVGVAWQALELDLREARVPLPAEGAPPEPVHVELARVALREPRLFYATPTPALAALLGAPAQSEAPAAAEPEAAGGAAPPAAPAEGEPAPASAPLELVLDRFELSGLAARYADEAREKPLRASLAGLGVELDGLRMHGAAPELAIASLALRAGELSVEDEGVKPPYRGHLRDLAVAVRELALPKLALGSLTVGGKIAEGGSFEAKGALREGAGDLQLTLRRLALAPYNPYAQSAAGYRVQGALTLDTKARVRGARYDVANAVRMHGLGVSEEKAGDFAARFGIPIDLALALLKDPKGEIALDVPLSLDERGAHVGTGEIVAGALRQALVGALSSPLKLVGAGFSAAAGGVGFDPFASEPGAAALATGQDERLAGLAQLLAERPALALRLRGRAGPADRVSLAERILVERAAAGEAMPSVEGVGFLASRRVKGALLDRGRGEAGALDPEDEAALAAWIEATPVPPERYAALARARAGAAVEALVKQHGVDPARATAAEPASEGEPGVVVELGAR